MKRKQRILGILILVCILGVTWPIRVSPASPKILGLQYTRKFKIEDVGLRSKKITDGEGNQLLLVPRGMKTPKEFHNLPVIRIPVQRALFASMTQVCLLRPFHNQEMWASVVGVTSPAEEWYIPEIRSGLQNGSIQYIGDGYEPDFETIQALQPDIVFSYGGPNGQFKLMRKLSELKIPYAVDNEYLETDPLGQLEWIRFIAAFYDQEQAAEAYFRQSQTRIFDTARKLQGRKRPKIAWGMIYNGKVYVAAGNSYVAKMINLAGGDYLFKQLVRDNTALNIETFYAQSKDADILINSAYAPAVPSIKAMLSQAPILEDLKAVRRGQVWSMQPWYNQRVDQNDQILLDLGSIFHPEVIKDRRIENFLKLPPR
ncbi:MAG TPA: ABC transporter substrate-binding protein [Firmicutes bacterium]|nr:ABC transporter substrate-binding protein [Bacillota bacterium]